MRPRQTVLLACARYRTAPCNAVAIEELTSAIACFQDAVRIEQETIAGDERCNFGACVLGIGKEAEHHPMIVFDQRGLVTFAKQSRRMPCIGDSDRLPIGVHNRLAATEFSLRDRRSSLLAYREEACYYLGNRGERRRVSKPSDLVQGTLDLLILKILALEPLHGWAVGQRLRQVSGDVLQVSDGSLYPALHKLEQEGWITAEWRPSENNRRAKYYSLTRVGRRQLEAEAANWGRLSSAISHVVKLREA